MRHYTRDDVLTVAGLRQVGDTPEQALAEAERLGILSPVDPSMCSALSHPIRSRILEIMQKHPTVAISPVMLLQSLDLPLGTISYHVRYLAKCGVLQSAGTEPRRGAVEHYYTLTR